MEARLTLLHAYLNMCARQAERNSAVCSVMLCSDPPYDVTVWTQLLAGSIVSTLSTFSTYWVTQSEYNEFGANVIHRKCP